MRITKSDVITVIKKEVYTPGNFALLPEGHSLGEAIKDVPNTKFDIIGALVRTYLPSTRSYRDLVKTCFIVTKNKFMSANPVKMAQEGNPLGALSAHFENITVYSDDVVDDDIKEELISFVNKYFPESIEVEGV